MNLAELQRRLMASARQNPPSDHVPYLFARRVMARLGSRRVEDAAALWARALWRVAAPCLALVLLLGVWACLGLGRNSSSGDLSQDFENTVLAATVAYPSTDTGR